MNETFFVPGFEPVPSWDARQGHARVWHFESREARLVLCLRLDLFNQELRLQAWRYWKRPRAAKNPFETTRAWEHADSQELHRVVFRTEADLHAKLRVLAGHLHEHLSDLQWEPTLSAERYQQAFRSSEKERRAWLAALPEQLREALGRAPDPLATPREEYALALWKPWALTLTPVLPYLAPEGEVPAHVKLSLQRTEGSREWLRPPLHILLGAVEREELADAFLADGRRALGRGRWEAIAEPALTLVRASAREPRLEPSKGLVLWLNRNFARTRPFADFLERVPEKSWRRLYEGSPEQKNPVRFLEAQVRAAPERPAPYLALHEHYLQLRDPARAFFWLGLGKLRAEGRAFLAREKLEAARTLNPKLPGLAAALREVDAALAGTRKPAASTRSKRAR